MSLSSSEIAIEGGNHESEEIQWRHMMIKKRCVEFWTRNPNGNMPSMSEKTILLRNFRSSTSIDFRTRLGAYNIPETFTDEQILNWDGNPVEQ